MMEEPSYFHPLGPFLGTGQKGVSWAQFCATLLLFVEGFGGGGRDIGV